MIVAQSVINARFPQLGTRTIEEKIYVSAGNGMKFQLIVCKIALVQQPIDLD